MFTQIHIPPHRCYPQGNMMQFKERTERPREVPQTLVGLKLQSSERCGYTASISVSQPRQPPHSQSNGAYSLEILVPSLLTELGEQSSAAHAAVYAKDRFFFSILFHYVRQIIVYDNQDYGDDCSHYDLNNQA